MLITDRQAPIYRVRKFDQIIKSSFGTTDMANEIIEAATPPAYEKRQRYVNSEERSIFKRQRK